MTGDKKFAELLEAYLAGKAAPEEQLALMKMIKSGDYDGLLQEYIGNLLLLEKPIVEMNNSRAKELLDNILNSEKHTAKLIPVSKSFFNRWKWAAAAAIVLVALSTWRFFPQAVTQQQRQQLAENTAPALQPVSDTKGKKYIRLQDGSTVLLNEGSRLEYPDVFASASREVVLTGEGYFDVKHDPSRPFIVHTGKVNTTVLGTAFNIRAYPDQKEITVTVTRGKVKVGDNKKTYAVITPNESIAINTANNLYRHEKVDAENVVEWKKQYFVLDNLNLEEAAALINNRYHVNISFSNEGLRKCLISATFLNNENLEQVLTVVTGVVNATYNIQPNDQIIISGEGCD